MRCKICHQTFRSPPKSMRKDQVCTDCRIKRSESKNSENEQMISNYKNSFEIDSTTTNKNQTWKVKNIELNTYQIRLIKNISEFFPQNFTEVDLEVIRKKVQTNEGSIVPYIENWGSWENFISVASSTNPPNKISLIIEFERIKRLLGRIPQFEDLYEYSKFGIDRYTNEFYGLISLIKLLGYESDYKKQLYDKQEKILSQESNEIKENNMSSEELKNTLNNEREKIFSYVKNNPEASYFFSEMEKRLKQMSSEQISKVRNKIVI